MDRLSECVIVRLHRWKLSYWADWTVAVKVTPPLYVMTPILDLSVGDYLCMKGFIQDWLLAFTVLMLSWHLPKCRLKAGKLKAISVIFRVLQYCKKKKKKNLIVMWLMMNNNTILLFTDKTRFAGWGISAALLTAMLLLYSFSNIFV